MNNFRKSYLLLLTISLALLSSACDRHESSDIPEKQLAIEDKVENSPPEQVSGDSQIRATVLKFNEVEEGLEPYLTRMLVSDRYIRIDEGEQSDGFVLFDRLKKRIFSVVDEAESILVVDPIYPLKAMPEDLHIKAEPQEMDKVPLITGIKPVYFQFHANGTLCSHLVVADGYQPEITKALQDYQSVLAAQQQETLAATPKELQTPCFLANYIYASTIYISKGFPLEQWDETGYHRSLSDIKENVSVNRSLFKLPDNYEYFSIGSGNIKF